MTKPSFKVATGEIKILFMHIASFQIKLSMKEGHKSGIGLKGKKEGRQKERERNLPFYNLPAVIYKR